MKKTKEKKEGPVGWVCPVCGEGVSPMVASCPKSHGSVSPSKVPWNPPFPPNGTPWVIPPNSTPMYYIT